MNIQLISVTPEIATRWLATNTTQNRRLSQNTVRRYAADMIREKWQITGETIKFDTSGRLIDGQHRLSAVVAARKTVLMAVANNIDPDAIAVIDTGKSRSAGDALHIAGLGENSTNIAALARKVIAFDAGQHDVMTNRKIRIKGEPVTNRDIIDYCTNHDLQPFVRFAYRLVNCQITTIFSHGDWAFIYWYLSRVDAAAAEDFLMRLATLQDVGSVSPIRTLFERITKGQVSLTSKMRLMAVVQAWNAWRRGESLRSIRVANMDDAIPQAV